MSVTPPVEKSYPCPPDPPGTPGTHPLLALALAVALAALAGILVSWEAAATVMVTVVGLFVAYRGSKA